MKRQHSGKAKDEVEEMKKLLECGRNLERNFWSSLVKIDPPFGEFGLRQDISRMFEHGLHTDFSVVVEDQVIHCHKCVLAARSPVFCRMLSHPETAEGVLGMVEINDMEYKTAMEMMRFIYRGTISDDKDLYKKLMAAGDKYELEDLKQYCERRLARTISIGNVSEMAAFADLHCAGHLRRAVVKYIANNMQLVAENQTFYEIVSNKELVKDVLIQASSQF
ncbi:unnamed protein product [Caenorhabditis auriculariae]|uniref:BTB domain-containing protein n=1 Tax=Caenorhabditis auriculariae TaxID=2777116 RepID=A0A8S1GTT7_9PELO|nr:unnamed protein product [Caenorhabditis auriculariae]